MNADVQLLLALIEIATKAHDAIQAIKTDKPEVYARVSEHHALALTKLELAKD